MNKKGQSDLLNILFGSIVVAGGALIIFNYVNLGLVITGLGVVFEGIKLVLSQGIK
jgi:hypothetical protein